MLHAALPDPQVATDQPLRILIVNYEYPPLGGGGGIASHDVAVEFVARNHEVHVLTSKAAGLPDEEMVDGVRVFRAPVWGRDARAIASFASMLLFWPMGNRLGRKLIKRFNYDIIHTWFAVPSGPVGHHLACHGGIPDILTIIGGDIYDPSKWYTADKNPLLGAVVRRMMRSAAVCVANSSDIKRRALEIHGFDNVQDVIPLGFNPPAVPTVSRAELGLDDDKIYLISVGRLVRRKSLDTVLAAMARCGMDHVHALLVGDGPEADNLKRQAVELGLADRVHFPGFVSAAVKSQLLANADIFVLPSLHEGFGIVYVEGMSAGLPVIAGRQGGQVDYLEDGKTGYLIETGDADTLAERLKILCTDPGLRRQMGAYNAEKARHLTMTRTAEHYERVMRKVMPSVMQSRQSAAPLSSGTPSPTPLIKRH